MDAFYSRSRLLSHPKTIGCLWIPAVQNLKLFDSSGLYLLEAKWPWSLSHGMVDGGCPTNAFSIYLFIYLFLCLCFLRLMEAEKPPRKKKNYHEVKIHHAATVQEGTTWCISTLHPYVLKGSGQDEYCLGMDGHLNKMPWRNILTKFYGLFQLCFFGIMWYFFKKFFWMHS